MPRLSDFLPPLLTRALRRLVRRSGTTGAHTPTAAHTLFGDFPDWASALDASRPYETDLTLYGEMTDQVRLGKGRSNRNLMPILAGLAMACDTGGARVLDVGGNLGFVYFDVANFLPDCVSAWRVVDLREVVRHGSANYADAKLTFFTSLESAIDGFSPNMVLCSHTLQYVEKPYEMLAALTALQPSVIVFHELPVAERERFMIQRLSEDLGGTERPVQILSSSRLTAVLSGYDLIAEIDLPPWAPDLDARQVAQLYRRQGV